MATDNSFSFEIPEEQYPSAILYMLVKNHALLGFLTDLLAPNSTDANAQADTLERFRTIAEERLAELEQAAWADLLLKFYIPNQKGSDELSDPSRPE